MILKLQEIDCLWLSVEGNKNRAQHVINARSLAL